MTSNNVLRYEYLVATNTRAIVAGCLLAILLGGTVAFTGVATPPIVGAADAADPVERTVHGASVSQHVHVDVLEDTTAYTAGETLTDRSFYPIANASDPVVTANADAKHATLTDLEVTLTYEAAARTDVDAPFYSHTESLVAEAVDGSTASVETSLPIEAVLEKRAALEAEFGTGVLVTVTVHSSATYEFEAPSGEVTESTVRTGGTVAPVGNVYGLPSDSNRVTQTTGVEADSEVSTSGLLNPLAVTLVVAGVGGAVTAAVIGRRADPETLAREIQRRRFREWVTPVESYTPQGAVNVVEVLALGDLVNLAIDTRRRVLYHRPVDEYIVVDGSTLFKYAPDDDHSVGVTEAFGMALEDVGPIPSPPQPEPDPFGEEGRDD